MWETCRMRKTLARIWAIFVQAGMEWLNDECPRYAASLSFYTVFSLAPLLVIVVAIVGLAFGSGAAHAGIVSQVEELAGPQMGRLVNQLLTAAARPAEGTFAALVALTTLVIGSTGVLVELRRALDSIWGNAPAAQGAGNWLERVWAILRARLLTFSILFAIGFLMLVSLIVSAYLSIIDSWVSDQTSGALALARVINPIVSLLFITLFFGGLMLGLPSRRLDWRSVLPGAFVSALLFSGGKFLIGVYLGHAATTSVYGAASSVVVVMLWVYFSSMILLYGAEVAETVHRQRHPSAPDAITPPSVTEKTGDTALCGALHDLRQPINAVRLYAESLAEDPEQATTIAPRLAASAKAADDQLGNLLEQATAASPLTHEGETADRADWTDCNLAELVDAVVDDYRSLARVRGLGISAHLPATPAVVHTDAVCLRRVVGNLVANAVQYTDAGRILAGVRRRGGRWVIEIRDTGRGIEQGELAGLFAPLRRGTSSHGTQGHGLGLANVRSLASALGISVQVASTPGCGSMFRLVLPDTAPQCPVIPADR